MDIPKLEKMTWMDAMEQYGCDKPDLRFGMKIVDLTAVAKGKDFAVFNDAEYIGAICAPKCAGYTRKQLDELTEFVKRSQIGAGVLLTGEDGISHSDIHSFGRSLLPALLLYRAGRRCVQHSLWFAGRCTYKYSIMQTKIKCKYPPGRMHRF